MPRRGLLIMRRLATRRQCNWVSAQAGPQFDTKRMQLIKDRHVADNWLERTLPGTQPAVRSCQGTGIKLFPAETHHCRLSDQHVIPPSPETVNILRVEPRSTRALIPQHGAHCRATALGDLSLHCLQGLLRSTALLFLAPRLAGRWK